MPVLSEERDKIAHSLICTPIRVCRKTMIIVQRKLNGGINKPTFRHYCLLQGVQVPSCLAVFIDLAAKHPEEGSNTETSVYLYRHLASFEQ